MGTLAMNSTNFEEAVKKGGILFLDWWAPWCGPCRAFAPTYERVAERYPDIVFGKINTDEEQELSGTFEIRSIPTLMIFRDGILLFAQAGSLPEAALEELVTKVRALDMDEVRKEIAKRQAQGMPSA